ncbi:hypothetical protein BDF21DRAFT_349607, partial [Thamnidium elegans]
EEEPKDTDMQEATTENERLSEYNVYITEDQLRYFFFIQEKFLMKPAEAAKLANVNYETARK